MIKYITSKDNDRVKYAYKLKETKYRNLNKQFLMESFKSLKEAISLNLVKEVFTYAWLDIPEEITQYIVNESIMKKLSSTINPEGVVFIVDYPKFKLDNFRKIIYLDNINDPGNMGTIIRTALAFNLDAVVASKDSVNIYNEKVLASSKGAILKIPVIQEDVSSINIIRPLISSSLSDKSIPVNDIEALNSFTLVVGNEAHGIRKEIINKSNIVIKIPINNIDSLNVAAASAILMYKLTNNIDK